MAKLLEEIKKASDINAFLESRFSFAFNPRYNFSNIFQAYEYASFLEPYDRFLSDVASRGVEFESVQEFFENERREEELRRQILSLGATSCFESLRYGDISPACEVCRRAVGSHTYIITLACNRDCYFCTNRNQDDYELGKNKRYDIKALFDRDYANYKRIGSKLKTIAITGGEPLIYSKECALFLEYVKSCDASIDTRIYTNGDLINKENLLLLKSAGLGELRIGLKQESDGKVLEASIEKVALARQYFDRVVIEMPIIPNTLEAFKVLLHRLDEIGVYGINILEFLYPHKFSEEYRRAGYKLKRLPYKIFYPYTYAGGLSVSGSAVESLEAMLYAIKIGLKLGIHYCSLENKLTGELYKRNCNIKLASIEYLSEEDYFIKVARAYNSLNEVKRILEENSCTYLPSDYGIDFSLKDIPLLSQIDGVALSIISIAAEKNGNEIYLQEVWAEPFIK